MNVRPGVWIYQNLLSHQNDYFIGRIDRIGKSAQYHFEMVFLEPCFKLHRFGRDLAGSLIEGATTISFEAVNREWNKVKRPRKEVKWAMIRAAMKALDK